MLAWQDHGLFEDVFAHGTVKLTLQALHVRLAKANKREMRLCMSWRTLYYGGGKKNLGLTKIANGLLFLIFPSGLRADRRVDCHWRGDISECIQSCFLL